MVLKQWYCTENDGGGEERGGAGKGKKTPPTPKPKKKRQVLSLLLLLQANKGLPEVQQQQRINLKKREVFCFCSFPFFGLCNVVGEHALQLFGSITQLSFVDQTLELIAITKQTVQSHSFLSVVPFQALSS